MKHFCLLCVVLLCVGFGYCDTILVATEAWEECTNEDGSGLYCEILQSIYADSGYDVKYEFVPYARSVAMVQNQAADMFIGSYYQEAEKVLYPAKDMFFDADVVSAVYGDGVDFQSEKDLTGKTIGWMRGYAYNEYLSVPVEPYLVDDRENAIKMLQHNRLDYFLEAQVELENMDPTLLENLHITPFLNLNLYFAFADNEKGKKLMKIYEERFTQLLKSGELKALFEKWDFEYLW